MNIDSHRNDQIFRTPEKNWISHRDVNDVYTPLTLQVMYVNPELKNITKQTIIKIQLKIDFGLP